jgi:SAM-dependent methyltransferase
MFGTAPSEPARKASALFKKERAVRIFELGGGQGRDTLFFAGEGFHVCTLDYSKESIATITQKAKELGLSQSIKAQQHDIRQPLPFADGSFDGCFSHMLYCMALTTAELELLSQEIRRVLKPGGLNIYTVRHTGDAHYRTGIHRGEDLWEVGGFIVHFFSREKVAHLAKGYEMVQMDEFEEGDLPRRLFFVAQRKSSETTEDRPAQNNKHDQSIGREGKGGCHGRVRKQGLGARCKAKLIDPATVAVAEWVRWKCMYGCQFYEKDGHHPPFAPDAESTKKVLREYTKAILLHGTVAKKVTEAAVKLEGEAYHQGYYKAFAFAALPLGPGAG